MMPRINKFSRAQGNILVITMVVTFLLGSAIASYLMLVQTQHLSVARSQAWNAALALAESGIEDGMAQVNVSFGTNYLSSVQTNWGGAAGTYGPKTVALGGDSYSAIIIEGSPGPTIIATGYTTIPLSSKTLKRTVQITTTPAFAFGGAIAALQNVTMNGNNITVDSYDSSDPLHSDANGNYDPATRKAGGDISSTGGLLNVGNADIYGHVRTAPFGDASTGPNGQVGDLNWSPTGGAGQARIQTGWYINDYNADFPDVTVPSLTNPSDVVKNGTGTNTYELANGDYFVNGSFTVANKETVLITGKVRLYVTGDFTMTGQNGSYISIAPGATLQLYVGTESGPAVSTTFLTVNNAGNAANFQYYGLPSNTSASWSGNASYIGTVYAPEAQFTLNGGGNNSTRNYQGSCVVKSVIMNGHFNFHYDEALKHTGPVSGYTIASWREL